MMRDDLVDSPQAVRVVVCRTLQDGLLLLG